MKKFKLFFVLIPCLAFSVYEKGNDEKPVVEKYVELLKSVHFSGDSIYGWNAKYGLISMPAFTYEDIDELLKYRNDTTIITNIPRNGMSSLIYPHKYEVRMIILWAIESIRVVAINSRVINNGRFPSLNPELVYRVTPKDVNINDYDTASQNLFEKWWKERKDKEWQIVSDVYYTWWTQNKDKDLNETMRIYPLQNTDYGWLGHTLYTDH